MIRHDDDNTLDGKNQWVEKIRINQLKKRYGIRYTGSILLSDIGNKKRKRNRLKRYSDTERRNHLCKKLRIVIFTLSCKKC